MFEGSFFHPSLLNPDAEAALAAQWRDTGNLRIEPIFDVNAAERLLALVRDCAFEPHVEDTHTSGFKHVYWQHAFVPDEHCDHELCAFGRWLFGPFCSWLNRLTGIALVPSESRQVVTTLYMKGSYLDVHNDYDGRRRVAYVFGLTPQPFPSADGGHLQFIDTHASGDITVALERPAAFNTLDLFDVRKPDRNHRVPILREHHERRAVTGWMMAPEVEHAEQ